jgi:hypothetical protein
MTSNEEILSALLDGKVEETKMMLVGNIVARRSDFIRWINHPEYLSVRDTTIDKEGDQFILKGVVCYRDDVGEEVTVVI